MPDALNIPLYFIRLKMKQLDPNVRYVVVCDTGRRSRKIKWRKLNEIKWNYDKGGFFKG